MPPEPAAGVPLNTLPVSETPAGNVPVFVIVGAGKPVATTVNDPAVPLVNVVLLALVIAGASFTLSVKFCVAFGLTPFDAVKVML